MKCFYWIWIVWVVLVCSLACSPNMNDDDDDGGAPGEDDDNAADDDDSADDDATDDDDVAPVVTIITIFDHFADADGNDLIGHESRWENNSLEFHGEAVAQSAIYGFDFMSDVGEIPGLEVGSEFVKIMRWSNEVDPGGDWLENAKNCFVTMYDLGSRIFNMSFGSISESTPEFDAWLVDFAREKAEEDDPFVVTIGSGNDPRNTSTFDSMPEAFGMKKFFPNYLATKENDFFIQVTGIEDNLDQVRWSGYESTYDDEWEVDVAATIKLWEFNDAGIPYWWGHRVGTSFSCAVVAGVLGYLQAYLLHYGLNPPMDEIRDALLEEAITETFQYDGTSYTFPQVEIHQGDVYTDWDEQNPYALDPSLNLIMMFDDVTDRWIFEGEEDPVTKEIVRNGLVAPANAEVVLDAIHSFFELE